jgi:FkbM family methyltransferase
VMIMSTPIVRLLDHTPGFIAQWARSGAPSTRLLRPIINTVLPKREVLIRVRSGVAAGIRLSIVPRSEKYYWTGVHERHVQETLADLLRPGMTFWDVGAHIGFFSILASRLVSGKGRVEAFEPYSPNRIRMTKSIELNRAHNIRINPVALSSRSGNAQFHLSSSSLMGSLVPHEGAPTLLVPCLRADDAARTMQPPHVMKIDTEGSELEVLRGASRLLLSARPTILIELTTIDMLAEAQTLLPAYKTSHIGANHWVLTPR